MLILPNEVHSRFP